MTCSICGRHRVWHGSEEPNLPAYSKLLEFGCHDGVAMDDDEHGEGWHDDVIYPPCPHNPARCVSCNGTGWAADPEAAGQDDCPDCVGGWAGGKPQWPTQGEPAEEECWSGITAGTDTP